MIPAMCLTTSGWLVATSCSSLMSSLRFVELNRAGPTESDALPVLPPDGLVIAAATVPVVPVEISGSLCGHVSL